MSLQVLHVNKQEGGFLLALFSSVPAEGDSLPKKLSQPLSSPLNSHRTLPTPPSATLPVRPKPATAVDSRPLPAPPASSVTATPRGSSERGAGCAPRQDALQYLHHDTSSESELAETEEQIHVHCATKPSVAQACASPASLKQVLHVHSALTLALLVVPRAGLGPEHSISSHSGSYRAAALPLQ
ncbi:hypothetical protein PCANC_22894 [Puccinia coronata f. sp. avenae]|uniref:Uncharacterized protein n=1 Tax=Puccinia coronata f. sp. avenae TaxID=200324 RepID=A0A2N5U0H7_9BASI|nr:hypothetical protein PCANC_22894 [Puccinia coronata f. sp. avenae]